MVTSKYLTNVLIVGDGGILFPPGVEIELTEDEAHSLLQVKAIAIPTHIPELPSDLDPEDSNPELDEGDEVIDSMLNLTAEDAIALVEITSDRAQLAEYQAEESGGKKRKSVLQAIEKRLAELESQ